MLSSVKKNAFHTRKPLILNKNYGSSVIFLEGEESSFLPSTVKGFV